MRIAMIGQKGIPAVWGGVERHVEHLASSLASRGHEVLVFARKHYVTPELTQEYIHAHSGVEVLFLPSIHTKHLDTITHTFFGVMVAMWRNVDIYHFHSVGPSLLAFLPRIFRPRATVITTFHSPDREHQKWGRFAKYMLTLGELAAMKFAHTCITVSQELQHYAAEQYGVQTRYVPNAVHAPVYAEASQIQAQYGLAQGNYFVIIARLIPHKGVHDAIEAFKLCTEIDKKLVIVGDASYTEEYVQELHAQAHDDPRIVFTGFQHGRMLQELWTNAYAYIQPSYSEGLSIALLEAASYGVPIICSSIEANAQIVGDNAILCAPHDIQALASAMRNSVAHPEAALERAKNLRKDIDRQYSWEVVTNAIESIYQEHARIEEDGEESMQSGRVI